MNHLGRHDPSCDTAFLLMNRCPDLAVRTLTGTGCPGTPCGGVRHALPAPFRRPGSTISRESAGRGPIITLVNADDTQGVRLSHQHTGLVVPTAMILHPPVRLVAETAGLAYHQIGLDQPFFKVWGILDLIGGARSTGTIVACRMQRLPQGPR